MTWQKIFLAVTGCAISGMVMGGLFGLAAGRLAPEFFHHIIPWQDIEPVGFAIFLGGTAGVLLGGGLGGFAILLQAVFSRKGNPEKTK